MAVCTERPAPGQTCEAPARKSVVVAAVDAVRNFLAKNRTLASAMPGLGGPSEEDQQRRRVQLAQSYMDARLAGRTDDVMGLLADDVELDSSRDGKFVGKEQFRGYLGKVKPAGRWKPATWNRDIGKAEILGSVKILMVNVSVVAHLGFDQAGKINRIRLGRSGK